MFFLSVSYPPGLFVVVRTLQWATAVAVHNNVSFSLFRHDQHRNVPVFFLPKHCTLWVVDAMIAIGVDKSVSNEVKSMRSLAF
jgi:hypothetical protein